MVVASPSIRRRSPGTLALLTNFQPLVDFFTFFATTSMAKVINWLALRQLGLLAWPNIWAQSAIVPELVGKLQPQVVAELALDFLNHPQKLQQMREQLSAIRGQPGAAQKLAQMVCEQIEASEGLMKMFG